MKNYLLLTFITLYPMAAQAMEGQISVARRNERITQLRNELARLQSDDIEAPYVTFRSASPINMQGIQVVVPQPAPAVQRMQDNPAVNNEQAETCCEKTVSCGLAVTFCGIATLFAYETIQCCEQMRNKHRHP